MAHHNFKRKFNISIQAIFLKQSQPLSKLSQTTDISNNTQQFEFTLERKLTFDTNNPLLAKHRELWGDSSQRTINERSKIFCTPKKSSTCHATFKTCNVTSKANTFITTSCSANIYLYSKLSKTLSCTKH